jgi:hypothetical protein
MNTNNFGHWVNNISSIIVLGLLYIPLANDVQYHESMYFEAIPKTHSLIPTNFLQYFNNGDPWWKHN